MNRKRQHQIEELAVDLLKKTGFYGKLPIPVKEVAELLGIPVIPYNFSDDISGVLVSQGGNHTIGINERNGDNRKRFTIAHELGHYILGHQREGLFVDSAEKFFTIFNFRSDRTSTGEFAQEREANAFAASLLMPKDLIYQVIRQMSIQYDVINGKEDIVEELAKEFSVSVQAMGFRMANLGELW